MLGPEITAFLGLCPTPVLIVGTDDAVRYATKAAENLFGYKSGLVGKPLSILLGTSPTHYVNGDLRIIDAAGRDHPCTIQSAPYDTGGETLTAVFLTLAHRIAETGKLAREANLRLRHIIEMLPQAVCVFDDQDCYVLWNRKYAELYPDIADHLRPGIAFKDILKISLDGGDFKEVVADKELWLKERLDKFRRPISQDEQKLKDGRWLRHDDRRTPDGGAIGMRIDITDLKQREEWLRQLFDANPMPMLLCDSHDLSILQANDAAVRFFGYEAADLLQKKACDMHAPEEASRFLAGSVDLESDCEARTIWRIHRADAGERHVMIYVRLLHEGPERRLLLTIADVTDRVLAEAEAKHLAHHDVLTGLPNRAYFYQALDEALAAVDLQPVTVFCLDLDGFKPVNDTFGHAAGDEVLTMVAERLRSVMADRTVARLGGDEFAVLCRDGEEICSGLADACVAIFREPFMIRGLAISIGVSIGIATSTVDGDSRDMLIQAADRALYRAKAAGRNTWRANAGLPLSAPFEKAG